MNVNSPVLPLMEYAVTLSEPLFATYAKYFGSSASLSQPEKAATTKN
jgi:hypothetical protein